MPRSTRSPVQTLVTKKEANFEKANGLLRPLGLVVGLGKAPRPPEPAPSVTTPPGHALPAARRPGLASAGAVATVPGSAADVSPPRSELWATRLMASASLRVVGSQRWSSGQLAGDHQCGWAPRSGKDLPALWAPRLEPAGPSGAGRLRGAPRRGAGGVARGLRGALGHAPSRQPRPGRVQAEPRRWAAEGQEAPGECYLSSRGSDSAGVRLRGLEIGSELGVSCPAPTAPRRWRSCWRICRATYGPCPWNARRNFRLSRR